MILIVAVRLSKDGPRLEHITDVRWLNSGTSEGGEVTRAAMVAHIEKGNDVYVTNGRNIARVEVVEAQPKYLRTQGDGSLTDNLLALPRF